MVPAGDETGDFLQKRFESLGSAGFVAARAQAERVRCWRQGTCSTWGHGRNWWFFCRISLVGINYMPAPSPMLWKVGTVGHPDSQPCLRDMSRNCKLGLMENHLVPVFCSHFFFNQQSGCWCSNRSLKKVLELPHTYISKTVFNSSLSSLSANLIVIQEREQRIIDRYLTISNLHVSLLFLQTILMRTYVWFLWKRCHVCLYIRIYDYTLGFFLATNLDASFLLSPV